LIVLEAAHGNAASTCTAHRGSGHFANLKTTPDKKYTVTFSLAANPTAVSRKDDGVTAAKHRPNSRSTGRETLQNPVGAQELEVHGDRQGNNLELYTLMKNDMPAGRLSTTSA